MIVTFSNLLTKLMCQALSSMEPGRWYMSKEIKFDRGSAMSHLHELCWRGFVEVLPKSDPLQHNKYRLTRSGESMSAILKNIMSNGGQD